jgi:hypothetical protein
MDEMLTLVVPPGAEDAPIAHGLRVFKPYRADPLDPDSGWLVRMPPDVAAQYLHGNTGFYLLEEKIQPMSDEMIRMRHPDGGSCGWGADLYEPDEHGVVTVPASAVPDLMPHGFRPVPDEVRTTPELGNEDAEGEDEDGEDDGQEASEGDATPSRRRRGRPRKE